MAWFRAAVHPAHCRIARTSTPDKTACAFPCRECVSPQAGATAKRVSISGVFRGLETYLNVALGREIVDFRRLRFLNNTDEVRRIGHVAVMQCEAHVLLVLILVEMIDAIGIER